MTALRTVAEVTFTKVVHQTLCTEKTVLANFQPHQFWSSQTPQTKEGFPLKTLLGFTQIENYNIFQSKDFRAAVQRAVSGSKGCDSEAMVCKNPILASKALPTGNLCRWPIPTPTAGVWGRSAFSGLDSCDLLAPEDSFAVSATSPFGRMPSANQTLFCSLGHSPVTGENNSSVLPRVTAERDRNKAPSPHHMDTERLCTQQNTGWHCQSPIRQCNLSPAEEAALLQLNPSIHITEGYFLNHLSTVT